MKNSRGDSAMFMMEIVIEDNPEWVADVMQNFVEDDFDIFEHFEETYEEPTIEEIDESEIAIPNLDFWHGLIGDEEPKSLKNMALVC